MLNEVSNYPTVEMESLNSQLQSMGDTTSPRTQSTQGLIYFTNDPVKSFSQTETSSKQDQNLLLATFNSTLSFLSSLLEKFMLLVGSILSPSLNVQNNKTENAPSSAPAASPAASETVATQASPNPEPESAATPKAARALKKKGDFLWKPSSEKDGKLVVLVPSRLTGRIKGVNVLSADGSKVLATGKFSGVGNGDREHFRFNKAGSEFPAGSQVQIKLTNGDVRIVHIDKPQARYTR